MTTSLGSAGQTVRMIAYSYPLLSVFWTMFIFFAWIVFIVALFHVFGDIFRSHDMGGFAKAMWLIFVIVAPFLGVFVYLIARGGKMAQHGAERAQAQDAALQSYMQRAAGSSGPADQLSQLASLRDSGAITPAEFEAGKAKVLA
ncbi:MAG: SHOCT domain-containing protein [Acidimicrobiia bacterium]